MKTILASAYDSKYPWGPAWKKSLDKHCNLPVQIIDMDVITTKMPNNIIQHGEFLDYLGPGIRDEDVILFSDADCILQRPFSEHELGFFEGLKYGDVALDYNHGPFYTLDLEGLALGNQKQEIGDGFLAEFRQFLRDPCYCTGVVAARKDTWYSLRMWFERYWPLVDAVWYHYARVQWLMSLAINRHLNPIILLATVTQHGFHSTVPDGMSVEGDEVFIWGKKVAIRHGLNLNPPKTNGPPEISVPKAWGNGLEPVIDYRTADVS